MLKNTLRRCHIKLILVRHGETAWNQQRRIQGGSSDVELSDSGRKQAEKLGLALKEVNIDAIYSSPLKRALDTAQAIARHHELTVQIEPDLREIEVGELEGLLIAEVGGNFSQYLLEWRQGQGLEKLPGGESVADLAERVWTNIEDIINKHAGQTVVVVSHFFAVVVTICKALGWPLTRVERLRVQTGSISMIEVGEGSSCLLSMGDTCHLAGS